MSSDTPRGVGDRELDELAHAWLDGSASPAEIAELEARVASDPAAARALARAATWEVALEQALRPAPGSASTPPAPRAARARRPTGAAARWVAAAAAVLLIVALVWSVSTGARANAALGELTRVLAAQASGDRTFLVRVVDPGAKPGREAAPLDGARLCVRPPAAWVLVRHDASGATVASGSDGHSSWSFSARGAVRVSSNPRRFRGSLPGEQHELPFLDPRDGLEELARAYDLALLEPLTLDGVVCRRLVATRKENVGRGPKLVEVLYEQGSASLRRMTLDRLPQAKGGPRAVALELVDERALPPEYFDHMFHHGPEREVVRED